MTSISIAATDGSGSFDALLVTPKTQPAGAVVLIQEIFGVNSAMRALSEWVADMGFIALTPDLFWRQKPGVVLEPDQGQAQWEQAFAYMNGFDQEKGLADLAAAIATARQLSGANGKVGTMGFCLGGRMAVKTAIGTDAECHVSYYGVGLDGLLAEKPSFRAPLLMHIAEKDKFVPAEAQAKILSAVAGDPMVSAHVYPGVDHAFARMGGHSWDARAAAIANGRTAEFLTRYLG
ncbi:dienelactone hydrolase family protein [Roseococcus sp. YIM B11640]|uniref:dienelactone hydrolase family protein n=1 Tax=Roseococcus sp. YIM B11640 TaxID=3133973 RepID=UPI003C7D941B